MHNPNTTGTMIRKARKRLDLTQEDLAQKLFVTKQAVSNWERDINLPEESIRKELAKIIGPGWLLSANEARQNNIMNISPLNTYLDLDSLLTSVDDIVNRIEIEAFEHIIRRMVRMTLIQLLGYNIYYQGHCHKVFEQSSIEWGFIAEDLEDLLNRRELWLTGKLTEYPYSSFNLFANKIEAVSFIIGGELFEDFDEDGYRDGFVQQIGRLAQETGYDLLSLIPEIENSLIIVYKGALQELAELLFSLSRE